jgi:predicted amino acid-binding ACT domain protein
MADLIRRVDYFYAIVPDKPGEAARILTALRQAGVNLTGFSGFPHGARRSQLDFIPEDTAAFVRAAKQLRLKVSKKKTGFLIQGEDRPGAVAKLAEKLAGGGINITAVDAVCAGGGRYGALLWVKSPDLRRAAKLLSGS